MLTEVPVARFDHQGDINITRTNKKIHRFLGLLHQITLILFVIVYLIFGGLCFEFVESRYASKQEAIYQQTIVQIHENIRQHIYDIFNEQLDEHFEEAYRDWRWYSSALSTYIALDSNRSKVFETLTNVDIEELSTALASQNVVNDRHVYKWTYSTAILYASTLVTTIGYGNIAPKTKTGKILTIIYSVIGILLVVSWLKTLGESLARLVVVFYRYIKQKFTRQREADDITEKIPVWLPIILLLLYLIGGSILFAIWEDWSYIDGAYFSFITFSTIGFGDLVPGDHTVNDRNDRSVVCVFYLLFGVMLTAIVFQLLQEDIYRIKCYILRKLSLEKLNPMNIR